jgi:hypothetical protein
VRLNVLPDSGVSEIIGTVVGISVIGLYHLSHGYNSNKLSYIELSVFGCQIS